MSEEKAVSPRGRVIGALFALAVAWVTAAGATENKPMAQPPAGHPPAAAKKATEAPTKLVDINGASRVELKTLPGIGDDEAKKIIAGRPYLSKAELATKNVLPTGVYLVLKDRVIAKQTGKLNLRK